MVMDDDGDERRTSRNRAFRLPWCRQDDLLDHVLNNRTGRRVAVIVNDMSEVDIDADLVRDGGANLSRTDEELVEMTNGCICCTLREEPLGRSAASGGRQQFDYLLIESTGISEPLPVPSTFEFRDEDSRSLSDLARLDTMVTVVDAVNLLDDCVQSDFLKDRGESLVRKTNARGRSARRSDRIRRRRHSEQESMSRRLKASRRRARSSARSIPTPI